MKEYQLSVRKTLGLVNFAVSCSPKALTNKDDFNNKIHLGVN